MLPSPPHFSCNIRVPISPKYTDAFAVSLLIGRANDDVYLDGPLVYNQDFRGFLTRENPPNEGFLRRMGLGMEHLHASLDKVS